MGNRAVITTGKGDNNLGIYIHWNGGPESVLAFLETAKNRGYRGPSEDKTYAMARLTGIIHEFFGPAIGLSLGIGRLKELDTNNGDNGVYEIGSGWQVIDRWGSGHDNIKSVSELSEGQKKKYFNVLDTLEESLKRNTPENEV